MELWPAVQQAVPNISAHKQDAVASLSLPVWESGVTNTDTAVIHCGVPVGPELAHPLEAVRPAQIQAIMSSKHDGQSSSVSSKGRQVLFDNEVCCGLLVALDSLAN